MQGKEQESSLKVQAVTSELLLVYLLAGAGFSCLIGWELIATFSPASVLLSYCAIQEAIFLRVVAIAALAGVFFVAFWMADWLFINRVKLLIGGSLLALSTVACSAANLIWNIPFAASLLAWVAFGIAQGAVMMSYCTFLSLIPTRRTALTIACGSCVGTVLFVFVFAVREPLIGLAETACLIILSAGILLLLFKKKAQMRILPVKEYRRNQSLTLPATLSVGCHGAVYGFVSILLCSMGPTAACIGGSSGLIGSLLAVAWTRLGARVEIDTGIIQRISLPLIISGLLLLPFFGQTGRIVCCCLVIMALAHASVMAQTTTSVENAEFQLHPGDRFARRQFPSWLGFFFGALLACLIIFVLPGSRQELEIVATILVIIVVAVFSFYGGNESRTKKRLNDLLTNHGIITGDTVRDEEANEKQRGFFQQRCELVIDLYELTPREAEVFILLAKGRNAEYISERLFVSPATIKSHIYHIYRKLGINSQQRLMNVVDEAGRSIGGGKIPVSEG
ncbi:MAG: LuxR C-terminal-related transcriptional regulator [Coriobacteriales bacterium]|jgi:DNA-binding CsgD family transcriptional regulator|nr:LuxR C-terminal-related transcriptional regulator [Coriobacteriales bacterium]